MPTIMAAIEYWPKKKQQKINKIMEKERKITAPEGCEIEKVEIVDGAAVITFKEKERKPPKSWKEFCDMFPCKRGEYLINSHGCSPCAEIKRIPDIDVTILPDRATAEAVLALCQLIQLRNAYNGDWVPDWMEGKYKYVIDFVERGIVALEYDIAVSFLYFKSAELRNEFLRNFRPLIEKLKPLYGIKEGGEE